MHIMQNPLRFSIRDNGVLRTFATLSTVLFLTCTFSLNALAASGDMSAQVTIDGRHPLNVLPSTAIGINTAVWDGHLTDAVVSGLLRDDGVKVMRYPGGSTSDSYHWQTNTLDDGTSAGPSDFNAFMEVVHKVGASPIITVNYGTGTPAEAAAWVRYANVTKHLGIKYWEIGNELYGNGTYGAKWEADKHALGATSYATNTLQFIQAMKAVDPTIKIGVVMTAPGDWPDSITAPGDTTDWNNTVLSIVGTRMDFADVHWYADAAPPGSENDAVLLNNTSALPAKVTTLHAELSQHLGSRAASTPIMLTESNSVPFSPGKQTVSIVNALFMASDYMTWLENGISNVDWWDTHNSPVTNSNNSSSLFGTTQYGDYGMLSAGMSSNGQVEPPANTPFPTYFGLQMVHRLTADGAIMLANASNQSLIEAHVVRRFNGTLAIMLINKDPVNTYNVSLTFKDAFVTHHATVYTYGMNSSAISAHEEGGSDNLKSQRLTPYSMTTIVFH